MDGNIPTTKVLRLFTIKALGYNIQKCKAYYYLYHLKLEEMS